METTGFPALVESGHHIVDDGTRIYYEVHGSGTQKVVLITGFHTSILTWQYQVEFFTREEQKDYQVLILDNRGYGRSDRPAEFYTTTRMALDAYSLIKTHLKWNKYHLLGHSMGGMIAQELSLMDLPGILSLTLQTTHCGGFHGFPPIEGFPKLAAVAISSQFSVEENATQMLNLQFPSKWLESNYEGTLVLNKNRMIQWLVNDLRWGCPNGKPSIGGLAGQLSAVSRHYVGYKRLRHLKNSLGSQGSPIMIITGTKDNLVRVQNSDVLKQILDGTIIKVDGAGHMVHMQVPDAFNKILLDHFHSASSCQKKMVGANLSMEGSQQISTSSGRAKL